MHDARLSFALDKRAISRSSGKPPANDDAGALSDGDNAREECSALVASARHQTISHDRDIINASGRASSDIRHLSSGN